MRNVRAFNITATGASHIKMNKVCQDASCSHDGDEHILFAIVCDGHGGDDYIRSDVGSKEAVAVAGSCIRDFINKVLTQYDIGYLQRHYEEVLRGLASSIISEWRDRIEYHYSANPLTEEELAKISNRAKKKYLGGDVASAYGTTLIAVAFTDEYYFGIKIGDGKCVAISKEGAFSTPIPDDGICFLNSTTSLCDKNAIDSFRYTFSVERPAAIFIGTDGIDDCFCRDGQLFNLYKTVLYSFISSDYDQAFADLTEYLPRLSAKGSGDDVSIGAVIDFEASKNLNMIVNFLNNAAPESSENNGDNDGQLTEKALKSDESVISSFNGNTDPVNVKKEDSGSQTSVTEPQKKEIIGFVRTDAGEYVRIDNTRIYKLAAPISEFNRDGR